MFTAIVIVIDRPSSIIIIMYKHRIYNEYYKHEKCRVCNVIFRIKLKI